MRRSFADYALPLLVFLAMIGLWEALVRINDIPPYVLPSPSLIGVTLVKDWGTLSGSLLVTLQITFQALLAATIGGWLSPFCSPVRAGSSVLSFPSRWCCR